MKSALIYTAALSLASAKTTFQIQRPNTVPASTAKSSSPLTNAHNYYYTVPVTIGNGQTLTVQVGTGAADLWLRGPNCASKDASCSGTKVDLSDKSIVPLKGADGKTLTFSESFGDGDIGIDGQIYAAPVSIGDAKVTSMPIGVTTAEGGFANGHYDGILGLGGPVLSQIFRQVELSKGTWPSNGPSNFFNFLGFQDDKNKFGIYLNNADEAKTGEVTMGGVDENRFKGDVAYLPVDMTFQTGSPNPDQYPPAANQFFRWWAVSTEGMSIQAKGNSVKVPLTGKYSNHVIADTGNTLMSLTLEAATALNAQINAKFDSKQNIWMLPCKIPADAPDLLVNIGSATFAIPPQVYTLDNGDGTCASGVAAGGDGTAQNPGLQIFGDVFLRSVYSIYDYSTTPIRVGFATAVHDKDVPPPPSSSTTSSTSAPSGSPTGSVSVTSTDSVSVTSAGYVAPQTTYAPAPAPAATYTPGGSTNSIYSSAQETALSFGALLAAFLAL
ncbi:Vacuolar protease A [Kappamyces sp. JEL0829]|nr:Vacuolar protease A [Kappamyces sp. JEL0829]